MSSGGGLAKSSSVRVQATNDDCTLSKQSACLLGYCEDEAIRYFTGKSARRTPLINRGYFIRTWILRKSITTCLRKLLESAAPRIQVVSLGSGYDTTFFWLASRAAFEGFENVKYVEVDYPALVGRKEAMLQQDFFKQFSSESPKHMLLGADLRKTKALQEALVAKCGVDPSLPTILITECVLNYIRTKHVRNLLRWIPKFFVDAVSLGYDQLHPEDAFGEVMMDTLAERGSPLLAIGDFPSCKAVQQRYLDASWDTSFSISMSDAYYGVLRSDEFDETEARELFDEFEDWHVKCAHYAFSCALTRKGGKMASVIAALPSLRLGVGTGSEIAASLSTSVTWELEVVQTGGKGRWGQSSAVECSEGKTRLWVFGGFGEGFREGGGKAAHERLNDTVVADVENIDKWERHCPNVEKDQKKLLRRMHPAVAPMNRGFLVFGGRAGPNCPYNDVIEVTRDGDALQYTMPRQTGAIPSKRWRHSMTRLGSTDFYLVYGGWDGSNAKGDFYVLQRKEEECVWHSVDTAGEELAARFGHTIDFIQQQGELSFSMMLYGGYDGKRKVFGELVSLELSLEGNPNISVKHLSEQEPRYSHASFQMDGIFFIIGGVGFGGDMPSASAYNLREHVWGEVKFPNVSSRHVWTRQQAFLLPDGHVIFVGGGLLCFSFGSKCNPLYSLMRIRSL